MAQMPGLTLKMFEHLLWILALILFPFFKHTRSRTGQPFVKTSENEPETARKPPPFLDALPVELVLLISQHLTPFDCASLALTSRFLLHTFGKDVLKFACDSRFKFLQRLERDSDGMFKYNILCNVCGSFHLPRLPKQFIEKNKKYEICQPVIGDCSPSRCEVAPPWLADTVCFTTVAAIMRSARLKSDAYPTDIPTTCKSYGNYPTAPRPKIEHRTECKVIDGSLILRNEIWIYSGAAMGFRALLGAKQLRDFSRGVIGKICAHRRWLDIYDFIIRDPGNRDEIRGEGQYAAPRYECLWTHPVHCATPACRWVPDALDYLWACKRCFTAFSARRCDVPSGYGDGRLQRAVVLTSWSDLGPGKSPYDLEWVLFMDRGDTLPKKGSKLDPVKVRALRRKFESR